MVQATFLIHSKDNKHSATRGVFKDQFEAHQIAFNYAQCVGNFSCECYVDGISSGFVSRHGDKTVYGDNHQLSEDELWDCYSREMWEN